MSNFKFEQRCAIKFCFKLGMNATETCGKLKEAYEEDALSRAQIFRWFKDFSEGRDLVEDEPRTGRPTTSKTDVNVERVKSLVRSDRRLTIRLVAEQLNLNKSIVHDVLKNNLQMRKVSAKLVPKNLTVQQNDNRKDICTDFIERIEQDPNFLKSIITGDESWIFEYDPETKRQSLEWHTANSPRPKKARMSKSKIKCMLICFMDSTGIIHKEFVPPGQTVNQHFYREVLERLKKLVARVRPDIKEKWMLHHDNAPCHTALSITEFLAKRSIPVVPQPPYSPDLSPCDFFLFPRLKKCLKGRHFGTLQNIQTTVTDLLKSIPASEFQHCYEEWEKRLRRCVASQGNYFEGNKLDV